MPGHFEVHPVAGGSKLFLLGDWDLDVSISLKDCNEETVTREVQILIDLLNKHWPEALTGYKP